MKPELPYNPNSPLSLWFLNWRKCIADAKDGGPNSEFYQHQAATSQMHYLCYMAQEMAAIKEPYR